jgi:aryl-alcohol dehydrogenase-like predicted oxidoreductase
MAGKATSAGTFTMGDLSVTRMGYGAMQLAGPGVFGPPKDRDACVAVLRAAVDAGINHIDTSDFYGPEVTNQIIREALHPYPDDLVIVTKVGAERDAGGGWNHARQPDQLRKQVEGNLRNLGVEALDAVNMRFGSQLGVEPGSVAEQVGALAEMRREGKIRHVGLSTVSAGQVAEAQSITPVVCVQNLYNIARRGDDALIDDLDAQGIAYVPYFPLGGFSPLQDATLDAVAARLGTSKMTVALAWLLQRSPNILLIPGTSSVAHLHENIAAVDLDIPPGELADLNSVGG